MRARSVIDVCLTSFVPPGQHGPIGLLPVSVSDFSSAEYRTQLFDIFTGARMNRIRHNTVER